MSEPGADDKTPVGGVSQGAPTSLDSRPVNRRAVEDKVEEVSAGIFDESASRALTGAARFSWTLYSIRDFLIEQVKSWGRNAMMRVKWSDDLPEEYRRDATVVEAGLTKMLKGPSYRRDVTLMNRVNSLFELHHDK